MFLKLLQSIVFAATQRLNEVATILSSQICGKDFLDFGYELALSTTGHSHLYPIRFNRILQNHIDCLY